MAKITITGKAAVITSALTLEDIKAVSKYRPDALVLKGGEDGKTPVFAVAIGDGVGKASKYGVEFGSPVGDQQYAAVTLVLPDGIEGDVREFVADQYGSTVVNLGKLEEQIPSVLEEIAAERAAVLSEIRVTQ